MWMQKAYSMLALLPMREGIKKPVRSYFPSKTYGTSFLKSSLLVCGCPVVMRQYHQVQHLYAVVVIIKVFKLESDYVVV